MDNLAVDGSRLRYGASAEQCVEIVEHLALRCTREELQVFAIIVAHPHPHPPILFKGDR